MINLHAQAPFAKGGNRLCYVHPSEPDKCIKVRRPDFSLEDLRRAKGGLKRLRPLSSFDDNAEEHRVLHELERRYGTDIYKHISRGFGFVQTDMGLGLVSELIRGAERKIAYSLKQYVIEVGVTPDLERAITDFKNFWAQMALPSRRLLPHNLVVSTTPIGQVERLVVVDGFGSPALVPWHWWPPSVRRGRAHKKTLDLQARLDKLLLEVKEGKKFSNVGRLLHDGTTNKNE